MVIPLCCALCPSFHTQMQNVYYTLACINYQTYLCLYSFDSHQYTWNTMYHKCYILCGISSRHCHPPSYPQRIYFAAKHLDSFCIHVIYKSGININLTLNYISYIYTHIA